MLKISASNFGPIIEGTVELKPLTVFVGPNNSGKSYMAMLIYSLLNQFPQQFSNAWRRRWLRSRSASLEELFEQQGELVDEVDRWARHLFKDPRKTAQVVYKDLPNVLKREIEKAINEFIDGYAASSTEYLGRYFGANVSELQRHAIERLPLQIILTQTTPHWRLGLISESGKLINSESNFDMSKHGHTGGQENAIGTFGDSANFVWGGIRTAETRLFSVRIPRSNNRTAPIKVV